MNLQLQAVSDALALFPVYPPQWVTPVQPPSIAQGGIPLSAFTPQGLEVIIEPITGVRSWVVAAFDVVTLFVNGVRTNVNKTIMPGEEGNRFLLYLPELWFINGVNDVFYRVTRVSGNTDDSPTLQLLYHNPAPTLTVSHPPSIGPGQPAVITLTVGYARPYDSVRLAIGTWSITFTNPAPTKPITHTLTAAELQQIGDGTHPVSARVIDQLTNSNVSPTTSITISANQKVYNPPIIVEAEPGKILDVAALNGKDATIHGLIWTGIAAGQQVWLKLTGQKPDGSTVTLQIWNGGASQVNATWVSQGFWPKPLPASFLSQLADASSLRMEFWVSEDKSNNFATATKFADQVYTINAVELVVPTISRVADSRGNSIPDNGRTFDRLLTLSGSATRNMSIEIFAQGVSKGIKTVDNLGEWSYPSLPVEIGQSVFTARAKYGTEPESTPWTINIEATLVYEITDFEDGTFNGWSAGPAASDPRDLSIRLEQGNRRLFNNTFTNASAGIVLKKSFTNLKVGQLYEFSIAAVTRWIGGSGYVPILSLSTSRQQLTQPTSLPRAWISLKGTFVAQENFEELRINSHQATHDSNDYELDNLVVRAI